MKTSELLRYASVGAFIAACVCLVGVLLAFQLDMYIAMMLAGGTLLLLLGWGIFLALSLMAEVVEYGRDDMGKN